MASNQYNRAFVNRFRQEQAVYPMTTDLQFEYLSFQPVSSNGREFDLLAKYLTNIVHDVPLISQLITILQNDAIPNAARLVNYIEGIKILFSDYANNDPYTSTYFSNLVLAVDDLAEQARTFEKDTSEYLLHRLKTPFIPEPSQINYLDIDTDTVRKIDDVIEYYMDNFEAYDNYFNSLLRQEQQEVSRKVIVVSEVSVYLSKLASLTDMFLLHLQAARETLFSWESHLSMRETQELYN